MTGSDVRTAAFYIEGASARGAGLDDSIAYYFDQGMAPPPVGFVSSASATTSPAPPSASAADVMSCDIAESDAAPCPSSGAAWRDYARLCFVCATSARWHGRFSGGGVAADESQLVFGREARAGVAGQHRLPAGVPCVVIARWAERRGEGGGGGGGGRLAMLGDANQLNAECPYVSPPVYPAECEEISAEVATLLQMNLRSPRTVRDASVLLYNEYARDGTLQPLHRDSAEGRPLETVEVAMGGRYGRFATAEDYAAGVAAALLALYDELCSDAESAALDRWWRCSRPTTTRSGVG